MRQARGKDAPAELLLPLGKFYRLRQGDLEPVSTAAWGVAEFARIRVFCNCGKPEFWRIRLRMLAPGLPFDAAANARFLSRGWRPPGEYGIQGRAQVRAIVRLAVARPAIVHLTAVDEFTFAVK